jgi:hypothetical protein
VVAQDARFEQSEEWREVQSVRQAGTVRSLPWEPPKILAVDEILLDSSD